MKQNMNLQDVEKHRPDSDSSHSTNTNNPVGWALHPHCADTHNPFPEKEKVCYSGSPLERSNYSEPIMLKN